MGREKQVDKSFLVCKISLFVIRSLFISTANTQTSNPHTKFFSNQREPLHTATAKKKKINEVKSNLESGNLKSNHTSKIHFPKKSKKNQEKYTRITCTALLSSDASGLPY